MSMIEVKVVIDKLEAKVKLVEEKEDGMVVDRHLVTTATIQYEGTPAKLDKVLWALKSGKSVDVTFFSPQTTMDFQSEKEKPEPAMAGS